MEVIDSVNCNNRLINLEELKMSEKEVIRSVQHRYLKEETLTLQNGNSLRSSSKIIKLYPFSDQDGMLIKGWREELENLTYHEIQHPTLLLKPCKTAELIIRCFHDKVAHVCPGITINQIKASGFWVIGCNSLVQSMIGM